MTIVDTEEIPSLAPDAEWRKVNRFRRTMVEESGTDANGNTVFVQRTFYTIGGLAAALGKETVTVRRWIRLGVIPDSEYETEQIKGTVGDARLRLWTEQQIALIVTVAHECGIIGRRTQSLKKSKFEQKLKQRWAANGWSF